MYVFGETYKNSLNYTFIILNLHLLTTHSCKSLNIKYPSYSMTFQVRNICMKLSCRNPFFLRFRAVFFFWFFNVARVMIVNNKILSQSATEQISQQSRWFSKYFYTCDDLLEPKVKSDDLK